MTRPSFKFGRQLCALIAVGVLLSLGMPAQAELLPTPADLQARMPVKPQEFTVIEPHLSFKGEPPVRRLYRGYSADQVLGLLLGPDWRKRSQQELEFRALDGYVSRIPVERFARYKASLVFALADASQSFTVDNKGQNEKNVPLGPYYLVWDNIGAPELLAEGASYWPYQITQITLRQADSAALLPASLGEGAAQRWGEHAQLAQKYCLSCHQINGFGGDKMPLNLAVRAKLLDDRSWHVWLLTPQAFKPGTSMPPLPEALPHAEREAIAAKLHAYLKALPVLP
ncbi:cytochrome c [Paucibacter sp. Y2R2-4]|uniref:cytochrome c n=1 Tax=Paucibacter sp. Y2R2-4 TaxID=2893553 RepID=UPI0021E39E84|nr:cytochrome c [Paucibacter sp. Y2R2-4]MCV2350725.1 cytochrome c [Paucibacter sp. Y2R2-4]